ncbi:hypothetical protein IFM89_036169 [Coptis chinensis]|uniref:FBD domain-containing protein n=1 Tax=Coptis chinensis TaxID=261450 RepID=A0A835LFL3_9MAGN|nr:hypothetical protein IFM89_036169 [Coptis chinensis]
MIITIVAPVLKSLCVVDTFDTLDCLDDECYNCEMKILCVGDLKSLTFDCNFLHVYSLHKLPSLVDPSMNFVGTKFMGNNAVHQVFREFCDVNDLEISSSVVEVLFRPEISSILPNLLKVINLEVNKTYDGLDGSNLICLLSDMPNIESLVFSYTHWTFGVNLQMLPTLPVRYLQCLESIELRCFYADEDENEIRVVEYLLKNARVLKKMTVISCSALYL